MASGWWPEIRGELCNGCGKCVTACPSHALAVRNGVAVLARRDLCQYDGGCELACPTGAIEVPYSIVFGRPPASASNPTRER